MPTIECRWTKWEGSYREIGHCAPQTLVRALEGSPLLLSSHLGHNSIRDELQVIKIVEVKHL